MISALLLAALRGTLVLILAALAAWLCRHKSAALRHAIWTLAILSQLVLPIIGTFAPQHPVGFDGQTGIVARATNTLGRIVDSRDEQSTSSSSTSVSGDIDSAEPQSSPGTLELWSTERVLGLAWLLGSLLIAIRFLTGTIMVARETQKASRPISREWNLLEGRIQDEMNIRRPATLHWGITRAVPYTWGIASPVICLPADADQWEAERLRMVLIHELSHVDRFDALTEMMSQIALIIFWFNPLLWLAVRRMRTEREHACDDRVLLSGVKPSIYVQELVTMMKSIGQDGVAPGFGAMAMARRSQFESRMLAVLNERTRRDRIGRGVLSVVAVSTAAMLFVIASVRPASAAFDPPSSTRATAASARPVAAATWQQDDFDQLVEGCKRATPKEQMKYCEVRTVRVPSITGTISFRGGYIDGVIFTSTGEPRATTVRALVRTNAATVTDARLLASRVTTAFSNGVLQSQGPGGGRSNYWSVVYEVTLPRGKSVEARTELGAIALRDFEGRADIAAVNGPLQVFDAAGEIKGRTESGPIFVGLGGTRWTGTGLDLQSRNGPIYLSIPTQYSAHLIAGTDNGPLELTYPLTVRRMNSKRIDATVGSGGPTVRVTTLNGPADIR